MLYIISLLVVAVAAMGLAVATPHRPLICGPAAGAAAGVLLGLGSVLAVVGAFWWAAAAIWLGLVCLAWGAWHTLVQSARKRDRYPYAVEHRELSGRTFTVERITTETPEIDAGSFAVGRLAVVDRRDGVFECLWRIASTGEDPEETEQAAAVCAEKLRCHGESARYVRRGLDPDSSAAIHHQIAVDNTTGGAR